MSNLLSSGWIDVSVPLGSELPTWPGDPTLQISQFASFDKGHPCQVTELSLSAHTGTHMDSMRHFIHGGKTMSDWKPEYTIGTVKVIEIENNAFITAEELAQHEINKGERIIFKTKNSAKEWYKLPFNYQFVCFDKAGAEYIASREIISLGIDYLSVGNTTNGVEVHQAILGAEIWIIEGLYLSNIESGIYEMLCLPVKLAEADGVPCRVLLRKL